LGIYVFQGVQSIILCKVVMKFYAKINISLFGLASKRAYLESRGDNDYVKVSIFPDFVDNFPIFLQFPFTIYFPILCKLYNLTL